MRVKSFAKINLGLEVLGKREDGYHEIRTLFQTVDLYDVLEFRPISGPRILLQGDDASIPWNEENLIYKAAIFLKKRFGILKGIAIHVIKNIPAGKGLGGGSSNAAITLYALNKLWELHLDEKQLMEIGRELGADIPYFLKGGFCLGTERGDAITPLPDLPPLFCLLVLPEISILTASVYQQLQFSLTSKNKDSKIIRFLESRDFSLLENSLEETVFNLYPQIKAIKSSLLNLEPELSLISGTGAAVFGLFLEKEKAERGYKALKKKNSVHLVETLSREKYWSRVSAGV